MTFERELEKRLDELRKNHKSFRNELRSLRKTYEFEQENQVREESYRQQKLLDSKRILDNLNNLSTFKMAEIDEELSRVLGNPIFLRELRKVEEQSSE